jgi:hypothetical protein
MKQMVRSSKGQKASRPLDSNLLKRLIDVQKLRKQVRVAEAAVKPRRETSQAARP